MRCCENTMYCVYSLILWLLSMAENQFFAIEQRESTAYDNFIVFSSGLSSVYLFGFTCDFFIYALLIESVPFVYTIYSRYAFTYVYYVIIVYSSVCHINTNTHISSNWFTRCAPIEMIRRRIRSCFSFLSQLMSDCYT